MGLVFYGPQEHITNYKGPKASDIECINSIMFPLNQATLLNTLLK